MKDVMRVRRKGCVHSIASVIAVLVLTSCGPQAPIEIGVKEVPTDVRIATPSPLPTVTASPFVLNAPPVPGARARR